jgi:serine phosphatase RsbU (regulator of sigma subunit)
LSDPGKVSLLLAGSSCPAALWSGAELRFTWFNTSFTDLMEEVRPQYDLLGMPIRGFLSDTQSAVRFIDVAYTGQVYTESEYEHRAPSGDTNYWQLTYLPVPGRIGDPFDVLLIAIDVTETTVASRRLAADEEELRRAGELIDVTVLSSLDAEDVVQRVLAEASEALTADWGWIAEREDSTWVFRNVHGWPSEMVGMRFESDELSLPALAAHERAVVCASNSQLPSDIQRTLMERHDIGAFVLVPLKHRGEVTGVLGFCWDGEDPISPARRQLARKLEVSLSLALENARLYEAERNVTRNLQRAFFAVPAEVPGFEVGHLFHSGSNGFGIGGGFYDVVPLDGGRIGVLVGEVAGAQTESAALTALVRSAMRAEALRLPSPASVMQRTNEIVRHGAADERVSAFFGLLEASSGHLAYSAAGHPAPILSRKGTRPRYLLTDDMILGGDMPPRKPYETSLDPDDLLVLYTGGLVSACNRHGEPFGPDRLLRAVAGIANEPAEVVPESLFLSAFSFAEGRLADDIAILALRRGQLDADAWAQQRLEFTAVA